MITAIALALVAFSSFAVAQQPATGEHASCCSEAHVVLAPLPADATDKERWLRRIHDEAPAQSKNIYLSTGYLDEWRQRLANLAPNAELIERFALRWSLSLGLVRIGELDEAIALCRECVQLIDSGPETAQPWLPETLFRLAAAHFRVAEKQNCIARHTSESCILPLRGTAVHVDKLPASAARDVLLRLLETPGSDLGTEAKWLLNIAHMAIGTWPDGVPEAHRIPASCFAPEASLPVFVDRARDLGLSPHTRAGSVAIDDFTGDGRLDVLTCSFDLDRSLRLCRAEADGSFTDVSEAAGLSRQLGGIALVQGDVDNDGLLDVLVLRGGGFLLGSEFPNSLLRQYEPGRFVDITAAAGIEFAAPSRAAAFADVDLDGDLDLFVACETERTEGGLRWPSRLFRNDGRGNFEDVTAKSGIVNQDRAVSAVFGDIDGDGDADLFVSNFIAGNRLFVNQGDCVFVERSAERGVTEPQASGPAAFCDFDNDGDLDLLVTYHHHYRQIRSVAAFYLDGLVEDDSQRLFENDGSGSFRDVTESRGMRRVLLATGVNTGDVDADGFQDVYMATGAHDLAALFPNALLLGGARFRDATFAARVGHLQKGNAVAFADIDDDGDLDLACQVGGYYQDDSFGDVLFENPGHGRHWLTIDLVGTHDNRFGIGARVTARVVQDATERDVLVTVGPGGSTGCNPLRAFLGLGDATRVAYVEVVWPRGERQRIEDVPLDAAIRITQGDAKAQRVTRAPRVLGGSR